MISLSLENFKRELKGANLIPIFKEIELDYDNPLSILKKISKNKYCFLLESSSGSEKWSRFSFMGFNPKMIFSSYDEKIKIIHNGKKEKQEYGNPFEKLRAIMSQFKAAKVKNLPRFYGGLVGFFSYEIISQIENLPKPRYYDTKFPDCCFMLTDSVVIFDNISKSAKIVINVHIKNKNNYKKYYNDALKNINKIEKLLKSSIQNPYQEKKVKNNAKYNIKSNFKRSDFLKSVKKIKKYIKQGDVIQTVISQRWSTIYEGNPINLYRALRLLNPSPYMFYIKMDKSYIIGASPEVLVRVENNQVESRPIAGTRPRGTDELQDKFYEKDLLADPKELAEHIMLVDLARNDISKVCNFGSVEVSEMMTIERYSHVMHIVSHVKGRLKANKDAFDVFKACFPAGTLSGAPKIRAMEIINELEPNSRGPYGGSVGYFGFSGNMDMSITIRSFHLEHKKLYFQAGAGIVADSKPINEFYETKNKSQAMLNAIKKSDMSS